MTSERSTPLLGPDGRGTRAIQAVLGLVTAAIVVKEAIPIVTTFPVALDLVIPLQAATRWLDGGTVYLADGFADLQLLPPFLYPPFVLPLVAPLTLLPEEVVRWSWLALSIGLAVLVCRRLAMPWWVIPLVVLWAPMLGATWGGNVNILLVTAFVYAFWRDPESHDLQALPTDIDAPGTVTPRTGFLAAAVASVKVSQLQAWLAVLRRSPRSAVLGVVPWVALVAVTLPLVGVALYGDWLDQVRRASDPTWPAMGPSLLAYLPGVVFLAFTLGSFALALWLRGPETAAWLGLLILIVTPNMHDSSAVFMLPALLLIRRELALLAVILTTTHTYPGWWLGIAIVGLAMLVGTRWPAFHQPAGRVASV